jgi:hypothetical protein
MRPILISALLASLTFAPSANADFVFRGYFPPGPPLLSDEECKLQPVSEAHDFVAASLMYPNALANIQLGDRPAGSRILRVNIEPGNRPLTVLLRGDSMIVYEFTGAVDRVARAIIASSYAGRYVAVAGLPANRVEFPELALCKRHSALFSPRSTNTADRDKAFEFFLGRAPDRYAVFGLPTEIVLPSMQPIHITWPLYRPNIHMKQPDGTTIRSLTFSGPFGEMREMVVNDGRSDAEVNLETYYPGGFRVLAKETIVSPVSVIEPEVYPSYAGLIQLERLGLIRQAGSDHWRKIPHLSGLRMRASYLITGPITIPAGVRMTFLVMEGVPAPQGITRETCIYFADDRKPISEPGYSCW